MHRIGKPSKLFPSLQIYLQPTIHPVFVQCLGLLSRAVAWKKSEQGFFQAFVSPLHSQLFHFPQQNKTLWGLCSKGHWHCVIWTFSHWYKSLQRYSRRVGSLPWLLGTFIHTATLDRDTCTYLCRAPARPVSSAAQDEALSQQTTLGEQYQ